MITNNIRITVDVATVLDTLRKNRENHARIVAEARAGYLQAAAAELEARLSLLKAGKVVALSFDLPLPGNYLQEYDTAISMLELHTGIQLEMTATDVETLLQDRWDWHRHFLFSNAPYSKIAQDSVGSEP